MTLNIGGTGATKPYAKYNSKADKWFTRGETGDQEITHPTFIADLANIRTGWLRFQEGQAPERVMDPSLDRAAPSPGQGFKRGFVVTLFSQRFFNGAAELASASIHVGNAIREVYAKWQAEESQHPGHVPVIACTGAEPMKDKYGTNYKPRLEITRWVERPPQLPDVSPVEPHEVWQGSTAAPSARPAPPPAAAAAPVDAMAEAEF